jgi:uncharacterized membrane protein
MGRIVMADNELACHKISEINLIMYKMNKLDEFIEHSEPLLEFVQQEIEKNKRKADLYQKITEQVLGSVFLAILSAIGFWLITHWKEMLGIKSV